MMTNPWLIMGVSVLGMGLIGALIGWLGSSFLISPPTYSGYLGPVGPDPEGWKFRRKIGGWDAYDPHDEKWMGWSHHRREWAVRQAQTVDRFDRQVAAMEKDREEWMKDRRSRRPDQGE